MRGNELNKLTNPECRVRVPTRPRHNLIGKELTLDTANAAGHGQKHGRQVERH